MEVLKYILSGFGVLAVFGGGLFMASKLKGSSLRKKLGEVVNTVSVVDAEAVHTLEVSIGKSEQEKEDIRKQIDKIDQAKPMEPPTNNEIVDFFDKMTKK